ncbi:MAG: hypothetical protein ACTSXF_15125 [Promethearchaeota archaeon]
MVEVELEKLEEYYTEQLNSIYYKHKRGLRKYMEKIDQLVVELKNELDQLKKRENELEVDEQTRKYIDRFYSKVKENLDGIEIPQSPNAEDVLRLMAEIKRLFIKMNELGRKNIKHFADKFKIELKAIDLTTRKISEVLGSCDGFIRKKYAHVKDAESLIKKISKLEGLIERIENTKRSLNEIKKSASALQEELDKLEEQMINIENNELFKELNDLEKKLFNLRIKFDDKIKFNKALKKLKKKLETTGAYKGLTPEQVRAYLSNPINEIVRDGVNHPRLTDFLVQLRYLLEEDSSGALQLKSEAKAKTLSNINQIVEKGILKDLIREYIETEGRIKEIKEQLKEKKLDEELNLIKQKISVKTQNLQALQADIDHKTSEYRGLLEKLQNERVELTDKMKGYLNDNDFKIKITLNI